MILVRGKPRHSQSQGSVERANQDIEKMLACVMKQNNSSHWSKLLPLIQLKKNSLLHRTISQTPYEAMFGQRMRTGIEVTKLPKEIVDKISKEDLEEALKNQSVGINTLMTESGDIVSIDDISFVVEQESMATLSQVTFNFLCS